METMISFHISLASGARVLSMYLVQTIFYFKLGEDCLHLFCFISFHVCLTWLIVNITNTSTNTS